GTHHHHRSAECRRLHQAFRRQEKTRHCEGGIILYPLPLIPAPAMFLGNPNSHLLGKGVRDSCKTPAAISDVCAPLCKGMDKRGLFIGSPLCPSNTASTLGEASGNSSVKSPVAL